MRTEAVLEPLGEARIALESVDVQGSLRGLMSEVIVTQNYQNLENTNIEATYTFPLPLDAVLLDVSLDLNGKKMQGLVAAKNEAENRYEDAIDEGDSAILLQELEPGLFSLNVGNILPNEKAVVQFKYAKLHRWQGESLRFHLPTTIAPRYGNPFASGLDPHQVPEYSLSGDYEFSINVRVEGELAKANFECPSHAVKVLEQSGARVISLSGGSAVMDRDFVLVLHEPDGSKIDGLWSKDNEEYVALASFHPVSPDGVPESPHCIKLVVDCSGSMGGDSIVQAKEALREIITQLKPIDYFNIIKFGTRFDLLFREPVIANQTNIEKASRFVERINADMGGTEIESALEAAYKCGTIEWLPSDLLLITDGEVWHDRRIFRNAQRSKHRIFTVGVGSAVSQAFVREIAEITSGACELVSPRENMSERIVRHFMRIDQPQASARIEWPTEPIRQIPVDVKTVYAGDTLHVFGWFSERPVGKANLVITFEGGRVVTQEVKFPTEVEKRGELLANLPRVAAHARLRSLPEDEAVSLAVKYQLVTEHTSCVLVFERNENEKPVDFPAIRKVLQTLAAGYGGMGSVRTANYMLGTEASEKESLFESRMSLGSSSIRRKSMHRTENFEMPQYLQADRLDKIDSISQLIDGLNSTYSDRAVRQLNVESIDDLIALGLDRIFSHQLSVLVDDTSEETSIVICFLVQLSNSEFGKRLSPHVKWLIRKADKNNVVSQATVANTVSQLINHRLRTV